MNNAFTRFKHTLTCLLYPIVRVYWHVFQPKGFGARALVFRGNHLLLIKTAYGTFWQTPGGTLNPGEAPEQGALRELKEETGLDGTIREKLGVYTSSTEGKRDIIHLYIVDVDQEELTLEWELKAAGWFSLDALPEDVSPATKRRINEYLAGQRAIEGVW